MKKTYIIGSIAIAIIATASIFFACNKDNENNENNKITSKSLCFEEHNAMAIAYVMTDGTSEIESTVNKDELREFFEQKSQSYLGEQLFLIDFKIIDYEINNPEHQPFCEIIISDPYSDNHVITIPISKTYDLSNSVCIYYIEDMNFDLDNEWDLSISEFTFNAIRVILNNQNHETEPINGEFKSVLFNGAISTITIENSEVIGSKLTYNGKPIIHKVPEREPFQVVGDAVNFMLQKKKDYDCVSMSIHEEESLNGFGSKRLIFVVEYENKDEHGCCWFDIDCINYYNNHH